MATYAIFKDNSLRLFRSTENLFIIYWKGKRIRSFSHSGHGNVKIINQWTLVRLGEIYATSHSFGKSTKSNLYSIKHVHYRHKRPFESNTKGLGEQVIFSVISHFSNENDNYYYNKVCSKMEKSESESEEGSWKPNLHTTSGGDGLWSSLLFCTQSQSLLLSPAFRRQPNRNVKPFLSIDTISTDHCRKHSPTIIIIIVVVVIQLSCRTLIASLKATSGSAKTTD